MSGEWNAANQTYSDCQYCKGYGALAMDYMQAPCWYCLKRRIAELEAGLDAAYKAARPYIAGGSEYTGNSGLVWAIKTIGERGKRAKRSALDGVRRGKELEAALTPFAEFWQFAEARNGQEFEDVFVDTVSWEAVANHYKGAARVLARVEREK